MMPTKEHAPMPVDPEMLRAVMRHWPTGVAVLTSRHGSQAHGMTVNSFTSISLEPPLVLACVERNVRTHALIEQSGVFAISFLGEGQAWISDRFAGRASENEDRFAGLATYTAVTGAPILAENLGHLDCAVQAGHIAGDHTIFVAEVVSAAVGTVWRVGPQGAAGHDHAGHGPLLYFDRGYHRLE
jgi:flavin reductase (DIM6/NTAB) family NADH-FMN oxidoreductase RutF